MPPATPETDMTLFYGANACINTSVGLGLSLPLGCGGQPNRRLGPTPRTVPCPSSTHRKTSDSFQDRSDSYCCGNTQSFVDTIGPHQATLMTHGNNGLAAVTIFDSGITTS